MVMNKGWAGVQTWEISTSFSEKYSMYIPKFATCLMTSFMNSLRSSPIRRSRSRQRFRSRREKTFLQKVFVRALPSGVESSPSFAGSSQRRNCRGNDPIDSGRSRLHDVDLLLQTTAAKSILLRPGNIFVLCNNILTES